MMPDQKSISVVGSAIMAKIVISKLLYGKESPHKAGKGEQVRRILLGAYEHEGGQIQMQFDLPDVTEVAEACGLIQH